MKPNFTKILGKAVEGAHMRHIYHIRKPRCCFNRSTQVKSVPFFFPSSAGRRERTGL